MVIRLTLMATSAYILSSPCSAADGLGTDWTSVRGAMFLAANRADVPAPKNVMDCNSTGPNSCRWDAGDGVEVLATNDGAGHLAQIEASWNNAKPTSTRKSSATFRSLCASIAGLAMPKWGKAQIAKAVTTTMIVRPSAKDSVDSEQAFPGLKIYGSRNAPEAALRDKPDEAFVQCGAVAD